MKISIVVPVYNEESIILNSYNEIKREIAKITDDHEIIFADDGSTDDTKYILKDIKKNDETVRIISWNENRGMGFTHRSLYEASSGDIVIEMDADLSIKPDIFGRFLSELEEADVVVASRYNGIAGGIPLYRRIPSRLYYAMYKGIFGIEVKDILSGFVAFRKEVFDDLDLKSDQYTIHIELLYKLYTNGFRIKEVPAKYIHRENGAKFSMLIDGPKTLINTLMLWFKLRLER